MKPPQDCVPRGSETVLLVDPDPQPRKLAAFMLGKQGYTVLEARSGAEALTLFREGAEVIDLVIAEVHMPRITGRELARQVLEIRPGARVLYMSDPEYANFLSRCAIPEKLVYLPKPFTMQSLAARVRSVLDQPAIAAAAT